MVSLEESFIRLKLSLRKIFKSNDTTRFIYSRIRFWPLILCILIASWSVCSYLIGYVQVIYFPSITGKSITDYEQFLVWPEELITRTNPQQRLIEQLRDNDELQAYPRNLVGLEHMPVESVWSPLKTNDVACMADINWIQQTLHENPYYYNTRGQIGLELTNYLEAFGHAAANYHRGWQITWFDRVDYCQLATLDNGRIKNNLCMGSFKSLLDEKANSTGLRIRIGLCLPESCQSSMVNEKYKFSLAGFVKNNIISRYLLDLEIDKIVCLPDESSPARQMPMAGWFLISLIIVWLIMILIGTIWDCYFTDKRAEADEPVHMQLNFKGPGSRSPYQLETVKCLEDGQAHYDKYRRWYDIFFDAVSLIRSLERFSLYNYERKDDCTFAPKPTINLCWLDFVKVFMSLTVLTYNALRHIPNLTNSGDGLLHLYMNDLLYLSWNVNYFIDTFFFIFALLISYNLTNFIADTEIEVRKLVGWRLWLNTSLGCLQRVGPLFSLTYLLNRLVLPYIGQGFRWAYGLDQGITQAGKCQNDYWFRIIPYLATDTPCNEPTWFVNNYLIYAIILPPLVYMVNGINKSRVKSTIFAGLWILSVFNLINKFFWASDAEIETESTKSMILTDDIGTNHGLMNQTSYLTHLNAILVGTIIGYLLSEARSKRPVKSPSWLTNARAITTVVLLNILILVLPIIYRLFYLQFGAIRSRVHLILFTLLTFGLWPCLNGLLTFLLATQIREFAILMRFMSNKFWHCLTKLTYCLFIIQNPIIVVLSGYMENELATCSNYGILIWVSFVYTVTFFSSLLIHLLIESPINSLIIRIPRMFRRKRR